jgi:hypothetical protein
MADSQSIALPEHLERHLGPIARGWSDQEETHGVQVLSFVDQPQSHVTTFATLGLSEYVLSMPKSREIRQELLISANNEFPADAIAGLLLSIAEHVLEHRKALLRGEIVGPGPSVVPNSILTEIFVTNPSPFDSSLTHFSTSPPLVFAYLIPVSAAEAFLVRSRGWRWFEEQLEQQDPDVWDLGRRTGIEANLE